MGTILTAVLWATIGAIFYKASSSIVWMGKYSLFSKKIIYHSLFLLSSVVEDLAFIRTLKYKELENSDLTEEQINFIKEVDRSALDNWKEGAIGIFHQSFPTSFNTTVKFRTWKEAMEVLDRLLKTT